MVQVEICDSKTFSPVHRALKFSEVFGVLDSKYTQVRHWHSRILVFKYTLICKLHYDSTSRC